MNAVVETKLPEPVARRDLSEAQWRTLKNNLYPGAQSDSILMVVDYCRARKLDPLKKPCHIVPMYVKDAKTGDSTWRDVVMPGIYEYRTTAQRTGQYMGHSKPEYGEVKEFLGVHAPEWCELTIYRWNEASKQKVEFPVRVYFCEIAATTKNKKTQAPEVNSRWMKAPVQMLTKCTEAAGLREAFPDEIGGEHTVDEMEGKVIVTESEPIESHPIWDKAATRKHYSTELQRMWGAGDTAGFMQLWLELDQDQQADIWGDFSAPQRSEMTKMIQESRKIDEPQE